MKQPIHPNKLLEEAEDIIENGGWLLSDYSATIHRLKQVGWSYRKIADWLTEKGIECTHNQVYYVMRSNASDEIEEMELNEDFIREQDETLADEQSNPANR